MIYEFIFNLLLYRFVFPLMFTVLNEEKVLSRNTVPPDYYVMERFAEVWDGRVTDG